jgi:hypothetical protein
VERSGYHRGVRSSARGALCRSFVCLVAFVLCAGAAPAWAGPAPKKERDKLVVLDMVGDAVSANVRQSLAGRVAVRFSQDKRLDVLSGDDVRGMASLEAEKQAAGCDDSCLAELAGALNARLVVSGFVGRLGSLYVVNLSLFDAQAARSISRATIEAEHVEELPAKVNDAVDRMRADLPLPAEQGGPPALGVGLAVGGGIGAVAGALALAGGAVLFAGQQSARSALDDAAVHVDASNANERDDVAQKNRAYADARDAYATFGVPLLVGGALVTAAGAAVGIGGAVLLARAPGDE